MMERWWCRVFGHKWGIVRGWGTFDLCRRCGGVRSDTARGLADAVAWSSGQQPATTDEETLIDTTDKP